MAASTEDALDIVAGTVPDAPDASRSLPARRPDAGELGAAVTGPYVQAHADSFRKGALRLPGPDHRREAKRLPAIRSRRRRRPADA